VRDALRWSGWRAPAHLVDDVIDVVWSQPLARLAVWADAVDAGVDDPDVGGWPGWIWDQPGELVEMLGDVEALLRDVGPALRWAAGLRRGVSLGDAAALPGPALFAWLATVDEPCCWFADQLHGAGVFDDTVEVFQALVCLGVDVTTVLGDVPGSCWALTPVQLRTSWLRGHLGSDRSGALLDELAAGSYVTVGELAASVDELAGHPAPR
jgi:hypothetical protein